MKYDNFSTKDLYFGCISGKYEEDYVCSFAVVG